MGSSSDAAAVWDIAVPSRPGRLAGLSMAGFRERGAEPIDLEVVPYPAVTVIVDLGDGLAVHDEVNGRQQGGALVAGMAPGNVRGLGRDVECLQVRLSPVLAHAVLGASAQLTGTIVALDDLWGRDAVRISERLRSAASWDDRFAIAEAALARRLDAGRAVDPEIAFAWDEMAARHGQLRIDGLAAEVGWSRKRLWSRFRSQIGLTPKRAAQLIRFDHAAHRLAAGHSPAQVAAETGYVDQSHLRRDALTFARRTPTALATAPWLAVDPTAWPTTTPVPTS